MKNNLIMAVIAAVIIGGVGQCRRSDSGRAGGSLRPAKSRR